MAYSDFASVTTAFGGETDPDVLLPDTEAEAATFASKIIAALQSLLAAIPVYGARGQIAHNAFMLSGLMGLAWDRNPQLIERYRPTISGLWNQIYEAHLASPYSSSEGMDPPALPLDPAEVELARRLYPGTDWLQYAAFEVDPVTQPTISPLPVVTPANQRTPTAATANGGASFDLVTVGIAAAAGLILWSFAGNK